MGGLSSSSVGSDDSFMSALSHFDSPREPGSPRMGMVPLWKQMLSAIEQEDRQELDRVLHAHDFAIVIQTLVTWNLPNTDNQYKHDTDVLLDAKELLGPKVDHLNLIQIACFLFNEEMALDMLNFVAKASEELESKKILYEFMGKMWGEGNTTLHLASFLGMADLTKRLLDLGANVYKMNHRKYKPVDCADENTTMSLFLNLTEGQESLPTSPTTDSGSSFQWNSFKSMGHMRSTSTSTIPLSMLASSDHHYTTGPNSGYTLLRPASTLGIASKLQGLLISDSNNSNNDAASQRLSPKQDPVTDSAHTSSFQGDGLIEDLMLTESRASRETEVDGAGGETILSPIVVSKFSEPLPSGEKGTASSHNNQHHSGTSSASGSLTKGEAAFVASLSTFNALHASDIGRQQLESATSASSVSASSIASHIRPKLRSYQSSPSIRLYASTTSPTTKEFRTSSVPKRNKGGKRVSFDPQSLMADASRTGDLELYKSMLALLQQENESKTLVEIINYQSDSRNLSSLHLAASYNHIALCRFLVQNGANVNLTDLEGWTPMHCAAAEGHLEVFEFLVKETEADLQAATYDGEFFEDLVEDEELRQKVTETLQAIYVRDYETRSQPKPHTVFKVEVHAAVRTWSVWKRYSEFEVLHTRFLELFPDHPPPQPLPTKHWWQSTMDNPELLEERRAGLETYLRGILSHRDDRWRLTYEWNEFLAIPMGRSQADFFAGGPGAHGPATTQNNNGSGSGRDSPGPSILSHLNIFGFGGHHTSTSSTTTTHTSSSSADSPVTSPVVNHPGPIPHFFTTESWLEEFRKLQGTSREVRSLINRRETHLGRNEISASHNCTIQSKKLLTSLGLRIPALENGLMTLALGNPGGGGKGSSMSDGELRRRQDMLAELKDEREVLTKLVIANRQNDGMVGYQGAGSSVPASSGDRNALMSGRNSATLVGGSGGSSGSHSQPGSIRGNPDNFSLAESTINGSGGIHSSTSSRVSNPRRVFGRVVQTLTQETSQTRGLDNEGLLLLQQEQMKQQDDHIETFTAILQRQKHIGLAIGQELDNQIQLLDELDRDVDRTTLKLGLVNKKIGKIN
ncbi:hypothetical protein BGX33_004619 [Mortierella sp. NVP41]|nr:hypothetical protein BGX33_004619 [Mortierella sp. NVP41]